MSRKITFLTLFLWLTAVTFPVLAQQKADTTYTFRFVPQKDMFYVPWSGNDTELARLLACIESNKADICGGRPKRDFGRSLLFIIDKDVHITFYRSRKSPERMVY